MAVTTKKVPATHEGQPRRLKKEIKGSRKFAGGGILRKQREKQQNVKKGSCFSNKSSWEIQENKEETSITYLGKKWGGLSKEKKLNTKCAPSSAFDRKAV